MVFDTSQDRKSAKDKRYSKCIWHLFYDHTNDTMFTHCYINKTSDQFIDFIRRADTRYDSSIKTIFVILDNASIHRSKKTINTITRYYHPRIVLVFLPTRSPHLNLIEIRWLWMQRQTGYKQFYL
jgi:transposase